MPQASCDALFLRSSASEPFAFVNAQLLQGARGQPERARCPGGSSRARLQLPGTRDLPALLSPRLPSTNRICGGSIALSLPGISPGAEWRFQIPFPALTAINSEPQGLPTEQISLSSVHPHSYGTTAPQRRSLQSRLNTRPTPFSEPVESDPKHGCGCPHLALLCPRQLQGLRGGEAGGDRISACNLRYRCAVQ